MKLSTYAQNTGSMGRSAARSWPSGTFSSSTMIVMMMAITPSLKASTRPLPIGRFPDDECGWAHSSPASRRRPAPPPIIRDAASLCRCAFDLLANARRSSTDDAHMRSKQQRSIRSAAARVMHREPHARFRLARPCDPMPAMCFDQHVVAGLHWMRPRVALEFERRRAAQQRDPFGARAVVPEARRAGLPPRNNPLDAHAALLHERVDLLIGVRRRTVIEQIAAADCAFHRLCSLLVFINRGRQSHSPLTSSA